MHALAQRKWKSRSKFARLSDLIDDSSAQHTCKTTLRKRITDCSFENCSLSEVSICGDEFRNVERKFYVESTEKFSVCSRLLSNEMPELEILWLERSFSLM